MKLTLTIIFTLVILISFLWITFGVQFISFGPDGRMAGDCPLSAMGASFCPRDILAAIIHHVGAYNSFFNVPVPGFAAIIIFLYMSAAMLCFFFLSRFFLSPPFGLGIAYNDPPAYGHRIKIIRWLALFENSPSFL